MTRNRGASGTDDDLIQRHREGHEGRGNTMGIYIPPECPWDVYLDLTDRIAELVFGVEREGWDGFIWSHGGECTLVPSPASGDSGTSS